MGAGAQGARRSGAAAGCQAGPEAPVRRRGLYLDRHACHPLFLRGAAGGDGLAADVPVVRTTGEETSMNYAAIKTCDIANGPGVRTSLFVSGCTHHCKGCFQPETWDFSYGEPFTQDVIDTILHSLEPAYVAPDGRLLHIALQALLLPGKPVFAAFLHGGRERPGLHPGEGRLAALKRKQVQQRERHTLQTFPLGVDRVGCFKLHLARKRSAAQCVGIADDGGQRRFQLMCKAGRKFLLTLRRSRQLPQPRLERIGHGVEILRQIAELVIGADRDAPVRLPGRKLPRRARNAAEGPRHIDRQSCRCRDRSPKHSGKDPSKALQFRLRFAQHVRNVVQASQRVCTAVQCKQRRCDQAAAGNMKQVLATYQEAEDLINIGAYKAGSNPDIDFAIDKIRAVNAFLQQQTDEKYTFEESLQQMLDIFSEDGE